MAPLAFFLLTFSSCKKDTDITILNPGTGLDTSWYNNYNAGMKSVQLKNELNTDFETDFVNLNSGNNHTLNICNNSLVLTLPANSIVDSNRVLYRGLLNVKSKIIYNNGLNINMLKTAKDQNGKLLQTLVSFYVAILDSSNKEMFIADNNYINVSFNYDNPAFIPTSANLYFGNETGLLSSEWTQASPSNQNNISVIGNDNISVNFNEIGWVSCSRVYGATSQQTKVSINLPSNYTNANTIAYLTIHDKNIALQFDPNTGAKQFQSISVPVGLNAQIVVISKQGNSYFKGSKNIVTSAINTTGGFQEVQITPTITTFSDMKNYINSL